MEKIFTATELVDLIKTGLKNQAMFSKGTKNIPVRKAYLLNGGDTLTLEYTTAFTKALDIKTEISGIMVFIPGFLNAGFEKVLPISKIAVKALDSEDNELLFAVSSKELAGKIYSSYAEWLKGTYFQENTEDYRLIRAKSMISDIENGLRKIIVQKYTNIYGTGWWNIVIAESIREKTSEMYESNYGVQINDGKILIDHTFTRDLKKIICADWKTFSDIFQSKKGFENDMERFNALRRVEAHNRSVSRENIAQLEKLYDSLLEGIAKNISDIEFNFLVDNWRIGIQKLGEIPYEKAYSDEELPKATPMEKIILILAENKNVINYIKQVIYRLESLKAPLSKKDIHEQLIGCYRIYQSLEEEKLGTSIAGEIEKIQHIAEKIAQHQKHMNEFRERFLSSES